MHHLGIDGDSAGAETSYQIVGPDTQKMAIVIADICELCELWLLRCRMLEAFFAVCFLRSHLNIQNKQ